MDDKEARYRAYEALTGFTRVQARIHMSIAIQLYLETGHDTRGTFADITRLSEAILRAQRGSRPENAPDEPLDQLSEEPITETGIKPLD